MAEMATAEALVPETEEEIPVSPYDMPGDWYVIHAYSGHEEKVKANLEKRVESMRFTDRIFDVHIPREDVVEIRNRKKVTVPKKVFPDISWCGCGWTTIPGRRCATHPASPGSSLPTWASRIVRRRSPVAR